MTAQKSNLTYHFGPIHIESPTAENVLRVLKLKGEFIDIQPNDTAKSPNATHYRYELHLNGYPINHGDVKVSIYDNGRQFISYPILKGIDLKNAPTLNRTSLLSLTKSYELIEIIYSIDLQYYISDYITPVISVKGRENQIDIERIFDQNGSLVCEYQLSSNNRDTTLSGKVFNPDPITTLETGYGSLVIDNDDRNSSQLIEAQHEKPITLRWNPDSSHWELRSDFAWALNLEAPSYTPPKFTTLFTNSLDFNRFQPEFEYVNAYYHLNKYQAHLSALGFSLVHYPLKFDAHAKFGADQSSFNPGNGDPELLFGDGGVDDAEDADVIVHEYGHAILHDAAPGTNIGVQRNAIDEGTSDYIAMSYSRAISSYEYKQIFNWDGHNEFWDGREFDHTRTYPSDLVDNIYEDGIMWASALMEINDCIGQKQTDSILFESIYTYFPFMTLSQAAHAFIDAEQAVSNGRYKEISEVVFCNYGLLDVCHDTLITELPLFEPYLGNTYDFAFNQESIYLYPNSHDIEYVEIYNSHGKLIHHEELQPADASFIKLQYDWLISGSYVLRLITDTEVFSFKLVKVR